MKDKIYDKLMDIIYELSCQDEIDIVDFDDFNTNSCYIELYSLTTQSRFDDFCINIYQKLQNFILNEYNHFDGDYEWLDDEYFNIDFVY